MSDVIATWLSGLGTIVIIAFAIHYMSAIFWSLWIRCGGNPREKDDAYYLVPITAFFLFVSVLFALSLIPMTVGAFISCLFS